MTLVIGFELSSRLDFCVFWVEMIHMESSCEHMLHMHNLVLLGLVLEHKMPSRGSREAGRAVFGSENTKDEAMLERSINGNRG